MLPKFTFSTVLILVLLTAGCVQNRPKFSGKTEAEKLNNFFEWSFNTLIERSPQDMAYLGINKKQDQLDDLSKKYAEETHAVVRDHLRILETFDRKKLKGQDRLSYDLYKRMAEEQLADFKWQDYRYAVNQMFGIQSQLPGFMINIHKVKSETDIKNYISRLKGFKNVFGDVINGLMRSEAEGIVPPQFVFPMVISDAKNIVEGRPFTKAKTDSPLMEDFRTKLASLNLSKNKQSHYLSEAEEALKNSVGEAYQSLIAFLEKQQSRATNQHGAWKFPKGEEYYQNRLRRMTTTNYTASQIHEMGLKNVARIHRQMEEIRKKVGFKGDLPAFFKHMRSKKFLYSNNKNGKSQYLKKAKGYIQDMRGQLDKMFLTQPKADIVVKAVEPYREKSAGMAFYQRATPDGSRPGTYYVNLYNMRALPKWGAEALAYHEGIPGHHMQLSIAQELGGLPQFRRHAHFTSYIEGWGLYSERLPKEHGFYKDPYSDFGRLSMELTRACRLVVDTGIHWKKWTREQAIAYLDQNLPGDHDDNVRQIQRYIVMPGQATAYMVGMLKIFELREKAKKAMGTKFDLRKFHDVILTSGPVPLDTLEELVESYMKST